MVTEQSKNDPLQLWVIGKDGKKVYMQDITMPTGSKPKKKKPSKPKSDKVCTHC